MKQKYLNFFLCGDLLCNCTEAFGHCATSTGQKFEPKVRTKATASEFASYNLCEDADISAQKYTLAYTPSDLAVPNREVK